MGYMKKYIIGSLLLSAIIIFPLAAQARSGRHNYRSAPVRATSVETPAPTPVATQAGEKSISAYVTGYSVYDNDPAGSTATWINGVGGNAGGKGTFSDPYTMAVGFVGSKADFPAGTMWYDPLVKAYFKAGDTCAACHQGKGGNVWLDEYVGGKEISQAEATKRMNSRTGTRTLIQNPASGYPVQ